MRSSCGQVKAEFTVPANVFVCMHISVQTWSREGFSLIVHALCQNPTCALSSWYMRLSNAVGTFHCFNTSARGKFSLFRA